MRCSLALTLARAARSRAPRCVRAQRTSSPPWNLTSTAGSWRRAIEAGEWCSSRRWTAGRSRRVAPEHTRVARGAAHAGRAARAAAPVAAEGSRCRAAVGTGRAWPQLRTRARGRHAAPAAVPARWRLWRQLRAVARDAHVCASPLWGIASRTTAPATPRIGRSSLPPPCLAAAVSDACVSLSLLFCQGGRAGGDGAGVEYRYLTEFQSHEPEVRTAAQPLAGGAARCDLRCR